VPRKRGYGMASGLGRVKAHVEVVQLSRNGVNDITINIFTDDERVRKGWIGFTIGVESNWKLSERFFSFICTIRELNPRPRLIYRLGLGLYLYTLTVQL